MHPQYPTAGATEMLYPTLINYKVHAARVFSCFRNSSNSDMDYMILNVRTLTFLCVRIHMGVGHTGSESAQHF